MATAMESPSIWTAAQIAEQYGPIPWWRICTDPPPGLGTEEDVLRWHAREKRLYELVDGVLIEKTGRYDDVETWTAEDIVKRFGPIPADRICSDPPPGLATEEDVLRFHDHEDRLFELIDGVLVEKTMGSYESMLAVEIARLMKNFVKPRHLGTVLGADGILKLLPEAIRIPDVSFIAIEKFPSGRFPREPIARLVPDLAVEVLSSRNTRAEMEVKLRDYFTAGVRLVWYVDPRKHVVEVFTSVTDKCVVTEKETLAGGDVLPDFTLSLAELFAELPPE